MVGSQLKPGNNQLVDVDTIAAISTPIGEGGIAVVRMSGPRSLEIADRCFMPARRKGIPPSQAPTFTLHYGWIVDNGRRVDEVLLAVMRAPNTYTREDMVEISCHGGYLPAKEVLNVLLRAGARLAEPGEFTKRAFLNGRLDLTQAEAVLDVIRAKTDLALQAAQNLLAGGLSRCINEVRDQLIDALAHIEAAIDFPEEGIEPETGSALLERMRDAIRQLDRLLEHARQGRLLRQGARVVLIGRPNAGKSSILNRLLKADRAIVSPIPGTTRDTIEETVNLNGVPIVLIDTAGLRKSQDPVEVEGIRRTYRAIEGADLIVHVIDLAEPLAKEDEEAVRLWGTRPYLLVLNKLDLPRRCVLPPEWESKFKIVQTCCVTGQGLDTLAHTITSIIWEQPSRLDPEVPLINVRHEEAIRRARSALERTIELYAAGQPEDITAVELRTAIDALGEVIGKTVTEDLLDRIFSQFCIGK